MIRIGVHNVPVRVFIACLPLIVGGVACSRAPADESGSSASTTAAASTEKKEYDVLDAIPAPARDLPLASADGEQPATRNAVFAGGCFWCTEAVFQELDGVQDVVSGYAGGDEATADYRTVASGRSGHAEAIRITYDPSTITFGTLLHVFFATHDPTQLNRQGPDVGRQYRSAVFYADEAEKEVAQAYIEQLDASGAFDREIATTLEPLDAFYPAESYHQDYVDRNPNQPYVRFNALPKVEKVRKLFGEAVKEKQGQD
ncbi:MAG: peptide-methionine (S)-S-oxide reductase MsrA [Planctomycetota bacterium]|nr:peptide-methionine (S)-S-oxide reductase MsrA [Planctomycetota bacterium]